MVWFRSCDDPCPEFFWILEFFLERMVLQALHCYSPGGATKRLSEGFSSLVSSSV